MKIAVVASPRCSHLPNIITGNASLLSPALGVAPDSKRAAATIYTEAIAPGHRHESYRIG